MDRHRRHQRDSTYITTLQPRLEKTPINFLIKNWVNTGLHLVFAKWFLRQRRLQSINLYELFDGFKALDHWGGLDQCCSNCKNVKPSSCPNVFFLIEFLLNFQSFRSPLIQEIQNNCTQRKGCLKSIVESGLYFKISEKIFKGDDENNFLTEGHNLKYRVKFLL